MNKTCTNFYSRKILNIEFYFLSSTTGQKFKVNANTNDSFLSVLKKYFKEEIFKVKSALLYGKSIDFNKTISENNIEDGDIININTSKDLNINSLIKEFSEIKFCLFFTSGHRIQVIAKPNDCFKSILKKYFNE